MHRVPSIMVAGVSSNVGKTSISIGLMKALSRNGFRVGAAKVGPDYIDPGFHRIATNRPSYNLDLFMTGKDGIINSYDRSASGSDLVVVEGVMGLFDGTDKIGVDAEVSQDPAVQDYFGARYSSAEVALILEIPIILVADTRAMSHSIAALVSGFKENAPSFAGVILNRVKSARHQELLSNALDNAGIQVLGAIPDGAMPTFESRHLGLIPAEHDFTRYQSTVEQLANVVSKYLDMATIMSKFRQPLPNKCTRDSAKAQLDHDPGFESVAIGVAAGKAFSFYYQENLELLEEAGAEIVLFDPAYEKLPAHIQGLIVGGGFPELFGAEIEANHALLADTKKARNDHMPIWAECGGMMWLGRKIDEHQGVGIIETSSVMTKRLNLGYRRATALSNNLLFSTQDPIFAHEFHYSVATPAGDLLVDANTGKSLGGFGDSTLFATYLHIHLGGNKIAKQNFLAAAKRYQIDKKLK